MTRKRPPILDLIGEFLSAETVGAFVLLAATAAALAWANSPLSASYEALWRTPIALAVGGSAVASADLRHVVNDGAMALFFFVVGLEIKRELAHGELRSLQRALLPAIAALGGMVVPAAIYLALNAGGGAVRGWGIPMATDIAFAVGALSLFAGRVPRALTVFLLGLAIADDIGAMVVIAIFYTPAVDLTALATAAAALAGVILLWRVPAHWTDPPLVVLMVVVWAATLASGVHATIAGVVLGLLAPTDPQPGRLAVAERLELTFHPWTSYIVVPLFALANAGVVLDARSLTAALASPVAIGIAAGLVIGKPFGILGASWLAVRAGIAALPRGVTWSQVAAVGAVAGIGFTISLFIAQLALESDQLGAAKVGVLGGSVLAAMIGTGVLMRALPRPATGA